MAPTWPASDLDEYVASLWGRALTPLPPAAIMALPLDDATRRFLVTRGLPRLATGGLVDFLDAPYVAPGYRVGQERLTVISEPIEATQIALGEQSGTVYAIYPKRDRIGFVNRNIQLFLILLSRLLHHGQILQQASRLSPDHSESRSMGGILDDDDLEEPFEGGASTEVEILPEDETPISVLDHYADELEQFRHDIDMSSQEIPMALCYDPDNPLRYDEPYTARLMLWILHDLGRYDPQAVERQDRWHLSWWPWIVEGTLTGAL